MTFSPSYDQAFPKGLPAPKDTVREWARQRELADAVNAQFEPLQPVVAVNGRAELATRQITSGPYAGLWRNRDSIDIIEPYWVLAAMARSPDVFSAAQMKAAVEATIKHLVVTPWATGWAVEVGHRRSVEGVILECTVAGTTGAGAPVVAGLAAGATVTDGTVTWVRKRMQPLPSGALLDSVPMAWNTFPVGMTGDLAHLMEADAHDSFAALLAVVAHMYVLRSADVAWLGEASGHAAGTRTQLLRVLINSCISASLDIGGANIPLALQGGLRASGTAYDGRLLGDASECHAGAIAMASIYDALGDAAGKADMEYIATVLKTGITALWLADINLFAVQVGGTSAQTLAGGLAAARYSVFPALFGVYTTPTETAAYVVPVYTSLLQRYGADLRVTAYDPAAPTFADVEVPYVSAKLLAQDSGRQLVAQRVMQRPANMVTLTDLSAHLDLLITEQADQAAAAAREAQAATSGATTAAGQAATSLAAVRALILPPAATDPTVDAGGAPVVDGATYYNTALGRMKMRVAGSWVVAPGTVLSGSGAPGAGTGADGDFYIDPSAKTFYGPKAAGAWPGSIAFGGLSLKRVVDFTTSGTFTKQAGEMLALAIMCGAGGGGASGARTATGAAAGGGGGGAPGQIRVVLVPLPSFVTNASVVIGAGGAGGAAVADGANGAAGSVGGNTSIAGLVAYGGRGGAGGTSTAGGAGGIPWPSEVQVYGGAGGLGATGSAGTQSGSAVTTFVQGSPGAGGGGGGNSITNLAYAGGAGQYGSYELGSGGSATGGTAGGGAGAAGVAHGGAVWDKQAFGGGGAGGGSAISSDAGNGGAGAFPGGGGGGGGGGRNGFVGGAGGAGAAGRVYIYVFG